MSKLPHLGLIAVRLVAVAALTLSSTACKHTEEGDQVLGYALIDPAQRHPILVTQAATHLDLKIARGRPGLAPEQRAAVIEFIRRYQRESTTGRLLVAVPSGASNEVAAVNASGIVKGLARAEGVQSHEIEVEPYRPEDGSPAPALKVSFMRLGAEAPDCGRWPANLAEEPRNLPFANLGCATQRNLAMMVDNPQDLITPRAGSTSRMSERRDTIYEKWIKGESTGAKRGEDEKVKVKNSE